MEAYAIDTIKREEEKLTDLITRVGHGSWGVYCVLALNMNAECRYTKGLEELAQLADTTRQTVAKRLFVLAKAGLIVMPDYWSITVKNIDWVLFQRSKVPDFINEDNAPLDPNDDTPPLNARTLLAHWRDAYYQQFGAHYLSPSIPRDMRNLKILIGRYDNDPLLIEMIHVVMRHYTRRWASGGFVRPTITALVSFLAEQAEPMARANLDFDKSAMGEKMAWVEQKVDGQASQPPGRVF